MIDPYIHTFVLSLCPFHRGIAFAMFEGADLSPLCDIKWIKGTQRHKKAIAEITKLIERFRPEVIVIEEKSGRYRPTTRIRKLYRSINKLAKAHFIEVERCTKKEVAAAIGLNGTKTKWEIADEISRIIPSLAHRMPPKRMPWQSEDTKQSLFDAVALGIAYFRKVSEALKSDTREKEE